MNFKTSFYFAINAILILISADSFSQWNASSSINTSVSIQPNDQQDARIVSDGKNGAIIVWTDFRNDATQTVSDIFVQRIDQSGYKKWTANGVGICTNSADQTAPVLVEDGNGGAIIAWTDSRNGNRDIYSQKIDSSGNVSWAVNGIGVAVKANSQQEPHLISDGAGGAIIAWHDSSNGFWDIYAQRINSAGTLMWTTGGVPVCNAILSQINERITTDGNGGAILTWQDFRNTNDYDIYAQRIDSSGAVQWTINGIVISNNADTQNNPKIKSDGTGGGIIAWQDKRNGNDYNIYAQHVNGSGAVQWTINGVAICSAADNQSALDITTDSINGAIISWKDYRNLNFDIYAQRISLAGVVQWTANGVLIAAGTAPQLNPNNTGDGNGGAIIVWQDSTTGNWDIRSQRVDSNGIKQWAPSGVWVGTAADNQTNPKNVSDGMDGCIYAWQDKRNGNDFDIYAHHIYANGTTVGIEEKNILMLSKCFPNPFSYSAIINWQLPEQNSEPASINIFDVNGKIVFQKNTITGNELKIEKDNLNNGLYFYEIILKNKNTIYSSGKFIITD